MRRVIKLINLFTIIACVITICVLFISIALLTNAPGEDVIAKTRALIALVLLVPIIVCNFSNRKIERLYGRKNIIPIAILTLILGNVVSGILILRLDGIKKHN